ncbi:butyrophilin-like protein 1 [Eleginops maclovinus]|uniref:butyrophilin-like protein 1 n=1 Tax=Eleginops maclovinus TaxID=56733 RepID=UPI003080D0F4
MAAVTSAQWGVLLLWIIGSVAAGDLQELKATPGDQVTLQCNSTTDAAVANLVWIRTDLPDDYIFFFRDNRPNRKYQDPRYRGRVELKDPKMNNGDVSVVMKEVSTADTGTYQCRVIPSMYRSKRSVEGLGTLVSSIQLIVSEGSEKIKNRPMISSSGHAAMQQGYVSLLLLLLVNFM